MQFLYECQKKLGCDSRYETIYLICCDAICSQYKFNRDKIMQNRNQLNSKMGCIYIDCDRNNCALFFFYRQYSVETYSR